MAISFLHEDLDLSAEDWNTFYNNIESGEFEVEGLGTFGFLGEGVPEFDDCERRAGVMTYIVENLEDNQSYIFKVNFYYSDHYDLDPSNSVESVLEAISNTSSLSY